ncbi:MAG: hypothetical protein GC185_03405 [Alphaproteobacteria bacterium]|nr:hypothetical protein [Alphaproteobacteria bacterium]
MTGQTPETAGVRKDFNESAEKIVNWDEYRRNRDELYWKRMTWKEKLFEAFVDTPYSVYLFIRRGMGEAWEMAREANSRRESDGPAPEKEPNAYEDFLSGDIYVPRHAFESDIAYALEHGLSKKFQQRAAAISREAFDKCRDFKVLKDIGQLRPFP